MVDAVVNTIGFPLVGKSVVGEIVRRWREREKKSEKECVCVCVCERGTEIFSLIFRSA
jgi:hypothetical protein